MSQETAGPSQTECTDGKTRRSYTTPVLRVFGTVAAITAAAQPSGTTKDGGPNNTKT